MRLYGLTNIHLEQVDIFRSKGLKTLDTSINVGFGDLVISGLYNSTGHIGTVWLQVPVDSLGDKTFNVTLHNFRISLSLNIDAEAECHKDQVRDVKITGFQIPMLYDAIEPSFEGMDDAFEAAVQGIVVVVLESQNILAVTAIKNIVSTYLDNIFC